MESKEGAAASLTCLVLLGMLIVLPSVFNSVCAAEATTAASTTSGGICGFRSQFSKSPCDMGNCADVCQHQEGSLYGFCLPFLDECLCVKLCSQA